MNVSRSFVWNWKQSWHGLQRRARVAKTNQSQIVAAFVFALLDGIVVRFRHVP